MRFRSLTLLPFAWLCAFAPVAAAAPDAPPTDAPPVVLGAPGSDTIDPEKREDPAAYRGRENHTNAVEVMAWVPRVALFPLYLTSEFILRRPSYAIATFMDRNHVVPIANKIMNPTPDIRWGPIFAFDFGSFVALGVDARWRNFIVPGHEIKGAVLSGGLDGYRFELRDSWEVGRAMHFGVYGDGLYHQDRRFYGFGPYTADVPCANHALFACQTYYAHNRYSAFAFAEFTHRTHVRVEVAEGIRSDLTGPGYSPSLETVFAPQDVPGFGAHMALAVTQLDVKLDTRRTNLEPSGGARLVGNATLGHDFNDPDRTFLTTTLDGEVAVEIVKPDRVLSLRTYAVDTFALGGQPVPFTYQPMLGFDHHFGFIWGRFRDKSALMAELRYHHPIGYFLDAQWIASTGNVFGQNFADFKPGALTASFSFGVRTRRTNLLPLELLVGFGTSRFDEAFKIDSVRVYLATTESL